MNEHALYLARNWKPDVDMILENGIAAFGIKGVGKSNLVALLVEQLSRFLLPQVIFDTECEYASLVSALPHGVLADASTIPSAWDILSNGLQVIIDLHSFASTQDASNAMSGLVRDLFLVAGAQAPQDRVPCAIHVDEAGYWLPQKPVSYLNKETRLELLNAFGLLASRGRKYGLVPFYFTQFISQIEKDVIRQCGLRVLMRQTQDNDIRRYGEYMQLTPTRKEQIAAFGKGEAIVHGLPDGSVKHVHFYERHTPHISHTPKAHAAIVKFAQTSIDYDALHITRQASPLSKSTQVKTALREDSSRSDAEIARLVGCQRSLVWQIRKHL